MEQYFLENQTMILLLLTIWVLPWKGVALWRASKNQNLKWFIIILTLNTLAVVDIIYIFFFSNKKSKEIDNN